VNFIVVLVLHTHARTHTSMASSAYPIHSQGHQLFEQRLYAGNQQLKAWAEPRAPGNYTRDIPEAYSEFIRLYHDPLRQYNRIRQVRLDTVVQGRVIRSHSVPAY
jgi:hypothetical protein